jgi:surface antigen
MRRRLISAVRNSGLTLPGHDGRVKFPSWGVRCHSLLCEFFAMRQHCCLFPFAASTTLAFALTVAVFIAPDLALAADTKSNTQPKSGDATCGCPPQKEKLWARPKFAELPATTQRTVLDETDEIAALESVQFALTEVGDGASYIWHRNNGRLSGMVQPVTSFKDGQGQICRHVVVVLTTGMTTKKTEGVACRLTSGQWKLEG